MRFPPGSSQFRLMFLILHCWVQLYRSRMLDLWYGLCSSDGLIRLINMCANRFVSSPCFLNAPLSWGRCSLISHCCVQSEPNAFVCDTVCVHRMVWFVRLNIYKCQSIRIELWSVIDLFDSWCVRSDPIWLMRNQIDAIDSITNSNDYRFQFVPNRDQFCL